MALVGLRDIHAAKLTSDTTQTLTYEAPELISGAINAKITPSSNSETLYYDDGPAETASALGEIAVELELAELTFEVQAMLLGHTLEKGVLIKKDTDVAPYVALGFKSLKSDNKYRYVWLYKGKFALPEQEYSTKTDTPQFNTGTITANFVKRVFDGAWEIDGDEDDPDFTYASTWFESVFELPPAPPPPPPTALRQEVSSAARAANLEDSSPPKTPKKTAERSEA